MELVQPAQVLEDQQELDMAVVLVALAEEEMVPPVQAAAAAAVQRFHWQVP